MTRKNAKSGADFIGLTVKLLNDTYELCGETYAATQDALAPAEVQRLIERAEVHLAEYEALLGQYTGGRHDAIKQAGPHIGRLVEFTDTLKKSAKQPS